MKKYFKLFILMLLIFSYSYSGVMSETDWKKKGLKGKVSQTIATIYKYDRDGKLEKKEKIVTHFNEQGYIKEEIHYSDDIVSYIIFKEYGKDVLLAESNDYQNVYYTHEYEYDKNGNLVETKRQKEKNKNDYEKLEKITYNKLGKKIKVQVYYQSEYSGKDEKVSGLSKYLKDEKRGLFELMTDFVFIYDKNGNLKEVKSEYSNEIERLVLYEATGDGGYKEISAYPGQQYVTIYDKNGNEIEWAWITQPSTQYPAQIQTHLVFSATKRDEKGNLTEQIGKYIEVDEKKEGIGNIQGLAEKKEIEYTYYK